jgi:hypothetical protein
MFTVEETRLLRAWFGESTRGIEAALRKTPLEIPEGLTRELLEKYRAVAQSVVADGKDTLGVQAKRLSLIARALPIVTRSTTPARRGSGRTAA